MPLPQRFKPRLLARAIGVPYPCFLAQEPRHESDHDNPSIITQTLQHAVRYIARMAVQRAGRRMTENDRRADGIKRVMHGLFTDMAKIDQHADAIHLAQHILTEICQAIVARLVRRTVRPAERLGMGNRHIPRAQIIGLTQHGQTRADRMAPFHPHHRSHFTLSQRLLHIIRSKRENKVIRIARNQSFCDIDLLDSSLDSFGFLKRRADIDRPELCPDFPSAQTDQIGVHRIAAIGASGVGGGGGSRVGKVEIVDYIVEPAA